MKFEATDGAQFNFDLVVNDKVVGNYGVGDAREKAIDFSKVATWGQTPAAITIKKGDVIKIKAVTSQAGSVDTFKFTSLTAKQ